MKATDDLTDADKDAVKAAYDAYNALSAEHKALVSAAKVEALNAAYDKLFDQEPLPTAGSTNSTDATGVTTPSDVTDSTDAVTPTTSADSADVPNTGVSPVLLPLCLLGGAAAAVLVMARKKS